eukprot:5702925-Prymnesium_polylepis.1
MGKSHTHEGPKSHTHEGPTRPGIPRVAIPLACIPPTRTRTPHHAWPPVCGVHRANCWTLPWERSELERLGGGATGLRRVGSVRGNRVPHHPRHRAHRGSTRGNPRSRGPSRPWSLSGGQCSPHPPPHGLPPVRGLDATSVWGSAPQTPLLASRATLPDRVCDRGPARLACRRSRRLRAAARVVLMRKGGAHEQWHEPPPPPTPAAAPSRTARIPPSTRAHGTDMGVGGARPPTTHHRADDA